MEEPREAGLISGRWSGYYTHHTPEMFPQQMELVFAQGRLSGSGSDGIGRFEVAGQYDPGSQACRWVKTYLGAHSVHYEGRWDGEAIEGVWRIPPFCTGGFRLWPGGLQEGLPFK